MRVVSPTFSVLCCLGKFNINCLFTVFTLIKHDLLCVKTMLDYIVSRLSSNESIATSIACRHFDNLSGDLNVRGHFLNLKCGHNAMFSEEEQETLQRLVYEAISNDNLLV